MSLALLFHYLMLNMFRMLIHLSSGACDLFVELFHGLYWSGSMRVVLRCGLWLHQHTSNQSNKTHEITQKISRKLLRIDVLTSETCWALNNEIIKQVKSSWPLFIQLSKRLFNPVISRISVYYEIVVHREFQLGAKHTYFYYCTVILMYWSECKIDHLEFN